jgi:CheY-like chemotaxis protein
MKVQNAGTNRKGGLHAVRRKWMVVDDTETILQMTSEMLAEFTNERICCFRSAEAAIHAFSDDPLSFELVVTDLDMPEMNGAELCQRLRAITPESKIILTTGSADISEAKAFSLGFDAFLRKPFTMSALTEVLEKVKHSNMHLRAA